MTAGPVRVLRVIARMNVGGPAHCVGVLSGRLDPNRYETRLAVGRLGPWEGSALYLAESHGVNVVEIPGLSPELHPWRDLRALVSLVRLMRRYRPHLVETHTAKAGLLGRLAAVLAGFPRPVVIHTYHGHVLEGYFSPRAAAVYRWLEHLMAKASNCLVGVSQATVDDLVRLGVAPPDRFRVIPIGLDLEPFLTATPEEATRFRDEVGARDGDVLLVYIGRLVPIKRLDVLLEAVALARDAGAPLRLVVAGDGEARPEVEAHVRRLNLTDHVRLLGFRDDLPRIMSGADLAVLTSDNEGTPVALIEAAAAGTPAVATRAGGVPDVIAPGTGVLVPPGDPAAFASALGCLAADPQLRRQMGRCAREHVRERFSAERLLRDTDALYQALLSPSLRHDATASLAS